MPDKRRHRGPDPEDARLFAPAAVPVLRQAASDLCWLLNRGYAVPSAVELVGNRYALVRRQRTAVARCVCSDEAFRRRQDHHLEPARVLGQELWLDGFNVLNVLEAALSGGVILLGRDGCYRDMAAVHGRYRLVEETLPRLAVGGRIDGRLDGFGLPVVVRQTGFEQRPGPTRAPRDGRRRGVELASRTGLQSR